MPREVHIGSPSRGQVVVGGVRVPVVAGEAGGGDAVCVRPARRGQPAAPDEPRQVVHDLVRVRDSLRLPVLLDLGTDSRSDVAMSYADGIIADTDRLGDGHLARAAAERGLAVIVRRSPRATLDEWLAAARSCAATGTREVVLCEGGSAVAAASSERTTPDIATLQRARERTSLPVLTDVSANGELTAAAVVAGADGIVLAREATAAEGARATELATTLAVFGRDVNPQALESARQAIDQVDACLANLLESRAKLASLVQRLKPVGGFAGRDPDRERELVATMARRAPRLGLARMRRIMAVVIEAGLDLAESGAADEDPDAAAGEDAHSPGTVGRSSPRRGVADPDIPRAS